METIKEGISELKTKNKTIKQNFDSFFPYFF